MEHRLVSDLVYYGLRGEGVVTRLRGEETRQTCVHNEAPAFDTINTRPVSTLGENYQHPSLICVHRKCRTYLIIIIKKIYILADENTPLVRSYTYALYVKCVNILRL